MARGRPRIPTALHKLQGTEQKHPDRMRARAAEPQPVGGIGPCPEKLGSAIAKAWDYLVESCAPGVLTSMDRAHLQIAAVLLNRLWADPAGVPVSELAQLDRSLSRMGMNPADRSKVAVPKEQIKANPFSVMLGGRAVTSKAS
ncbi:MAG: hypothetical protein DDT39_01139 [Firmicutes bacterium]|nr:hypothetical protein [candidate division NPL-UPA2 bacterium]